MNKRRLLRRLDGVETTGLMTLTCRPDVWLNPPQAFQGMSRAVNLLVKRIRRQWPNHRCEYFLVWERTAKGWPHAHLLIRAPYIPQHWLSAQWLTLTKAPIVDIRPIKDPLNVASYITKYLAKDPYVPQGMKRYRMSQGFLAAIQALPPELASRPTNWRLVPSSALELAHEYARSGYTAQQHSGGSFTLFPAGTPNAPVLDSLTFWPQCATVTT